MGRFPDGCEIEIGPFGSQVALGTRRVDRGDSDLNEDLSGFGAKGQDGLGGLACLVSDK